MPIINRHLGGMRMLQQFISDNAGDLGVLEKDFDKFYSSYMKLIKGAEGELQVTKRLRTFKGESIIHHDDILENIDKQTLQIDHMLITKYCIFIIETKNWNKVYANEKHVKNAVDNVKKGGNCVYHLLKTHFPDLKTKEIVVMTGEKVLDEDQSVVEKHYGKKVEICSLKRLNSVIGEYQDYLEKKEGSTFSNEDLIHISRILMDKNKNPSFLGSLCMK